MISERPRSVVAHDQPTFIELVLGGAGRGADAAIFPGLAIVLAANSKSRLSTSLTDNDVSDGLRISLGSAYLADLSPRRG